MAERGTYVRVAAALRDQVRAGQLAPGARLPSETALAREFGISRGTARAALALLETEGIAEVLPGVGRRVVGKASTDAAPTTAYEVVAREIRKEIAHLHLGPVARLPSETQLMERFGVSRNTVRRAYAVLAEEGVVSIRHGVGAFVSASERKQQQARPREC